MPDWSYHTLLRPAASLLPRGSVRPAVLGSLRAIASTSVGRGFIDLLGHMDPPPGAARTVAGMRLLSPVGLGAGVDPDGVALQAFARFGFGVIELGPYAVGAARASSPCQPPLQAGTWPPRLGRRPPALRVLVRFAVQAGDEAALAELQEKLESVAGAVDGVSLVILDGPPSGGFAAAALAVCRAAGMNHVFMDEPFGAGPRIARGGLGSPRQIAAALEAGASLALVDTGFLEAGPGLAKRANELIAFEAKGSRAPEPRSPWRLGWPWMALLGAGMAIAGLVVLAVGMTTVTLPYDESFLGLSHRAIAALNPRLIGFMRHDRVTLAGTMVSLGVLYAGLALGGMRRGWTWARPAAIGSGAAGFATIFLFLGYHYVDPLHVALAVLLFPLFLAGALLETARAQPSASDLDNDRVWRAGLWGQLYFVGLGAGLLVAGIVICLVGVTGVFVWSDLQFLGTTSQALSRANSHLLPLIAHDRAGFGGALASDGIGVLLLSLWGFRRGERWIWWTLLLAGSAGFLGAVFAHLAVGYLEFGHLLPVAVSGAVFIAGLALSGPYLLCRPMALAPSPSPEGVEGGAHAASRSRR